MPRDALLDRIQAFGGHERTVEQLGGGLTNTCLRVRLVGGGDYVVRIGADRSATPAVDRADERHNSVVAGQVGVGPRVVETLPEDDVLVVEFLPGRSLAPSDVRDPATIPRIAAAVRALHRAPGFRGRFDLRQIRHRYLEIIAEGGLRLPDGYLDLQPRAESLEDAIRRHPERLVPCHNDLAAANLLDDGTAIRIVDYEHSAMNEASFELGNLAGESGLDDEALALLLESYWERPSPHRLARAQAWSLLARYSWTTWASIQDAQSTVDFDFWSSGLARFDSARDELLGSRYRTLLDALDAVD